MSQARVTDFFSQRKKVNSEAAKGAKRRIGIASSSTVSYKPPGCRAAENKDSVLCSSSVHKEFLRVIDEAAGLNHHHNNNINNGGESEPGKESVVISSPRTPKRSSAEAEITEHSSVKKRREAAEVRKANREKTTKRSARKKLLLQEDATQAPRKVDIASLKSQLQRIKKQSEDTGDTASSTSSASASMSSTSSSTAAANSATPAASKTAVPLPTDANPLSDTVAQARELAAKALRRKEKREADRIKQAETQTQDRTEQPAYQRYHTLAQAVPPGLSLPYQYKVLAEMFRSMETVIAMLYNRSETATFSRIKQAVQDMMHKRFEESHVCQIKTVFPEAYSFKQEKNILTFGSSVLKSSYQLTVEPLFGPDQNEARPVLSASHLLERRRVFHQNLVSIVKQHHKDFLSSLVPPVSIPEDKLTRWHPRFNVDTVPAVPPSSLPRPPVTEKLTTAQEVLDKARSLITPKMEKALVSLSLSTEDKDTQSSGSTRPQNPAVSQTPPAPAAQLPAPLRGVSQSLLDRIRAKEAQKLQAAMTRSPAQDERLLMMSRLAELARILRNVFVAEKKGALIMEAACNKMVASYRSSLSTGEMEKHLRLLAEVAADWLTIHQIRKDFYLKLNKNMELSIVLEKLTRRLQEEEKL
ncbi:DNA replication factor Cdt1 isoform X2 [Kryptolebias marmoratus]|uniref:DNA replication factor Cdt1 isoform X2 n=1 Tax=Kryptolebias marmoratus TaxID=37003 RepID=UPI0007F91A33|nr:DNA replication factor Cdt1 isoform X2 [Kryptolebias marmoratus]